MEENKQQNQIQISDSLTGGEYANFMQVNHNRDEFFLLFANIFPPKGKVVGKIITNPGHFKLMVRALEDNLKKYESQFGEIKIEEKEKREIGFTPKN